MAPVKMMHSSSLLSSGWIRCSPVAAVILRHVSFKLATCRRRIKRWPICFSAPVWSVCFCCHFESHCCLLLPGCVCVCVCVCAHACVCAYVCARVCVHVCVCVCVFSQQVCCVCSSVLCFWGVTSAEGGGGRGVRGGGDVA